MRDCKFIVLFIFLLPNFVCANDSWVEESVRYLENRYSLFLEDMPRIEEINRRAEFALESEPNNVHLLYLKGRTEHLLLSMKVILHKQENRQGSPLDEAWYKEHFREYVDSYSKALEFDNLAEPGNTLVAGELVGMSGGVILPPNIMAKVIRLHLERGDPRGENWHWNQYTAMVTAYHSANQFAEAQSILDEMLSVFPSRQDEILSAKQSIARKEQVYLDSLQAEAQEGSRETDAAALGGEPITAEQTDTTSQTKIIVPAEQNAIKPLWIAITVILFLAIVVALFLYMKKRRRREKR